MQLDLNPSGRLLVQVKYFQQASGGKKIVIIIIIIIIQFENINNFHTRLRLLPRNEVSPHIHEHCSFRLQSKQFHVIIHSEYHKKSIKDYKKPHYAPCSSFEDTSHIHLTIFPRSKLCRFPTFIAHFFIPLCQRTLDTSSIHLSFYVIWCTTTGQNGR